MVGHFSKPIFIELPLCDVVFYFYLLSLLYESISFFILSNLFIQFLYFTYFIHFVFIISVLQLFVSNHQAINAIYIIRHCNLH